MVVIVFDFDDTLFSTWHYSPLESDLKKQKEMGMNVDDTTFHCPELSKSINNLLERASKIGKVYIITNAERSWVKQCLKRYLPDCDQLENLANSEEYLFSSRDSGIGKEYPDETGIWKYHAFQRKLSKVFNENKDYKQLIAFGDAQGDRHASLEFKKTFEHIIVKNILFTSCPSLNQIIGQHNRVSKQFDWLTKVEGDLDLMTMVTETINAIEEDDVEVVSEAQEVVQEKYEAVSNLEYEDSIHEQNAWYDNNVPYAGRCLHIDDYLHSC